MIARVLWVFIVAVIAAGMFSVGWWASRAVLESPADPLTPPQAELYTVVEGTVGRSLSMVALAEWPLQPAGLNPAAGTVTTVDVEPGAVVEAGDVLYTVDLRPVVIAEGEVPAFRALSQRAEGADVAQLQRFLSVLGFYDDEIDGSFGTSTRLAVRAWQDASGIAVDGVVRHGDLVFVAELPARVVLDEAITVGAQVSAGDPAVDWLASTPTFRVPLATEQRNVVPLDADVTLSHPDGVWRGVIAEVTERPSAGEIDLWLTAPDGGALCDNDCNGAVPVTGVTDYVVEVVAVPEVTGPIVPVAALETGPDGSVTVNGTNGPISVSVMAASNGLAVVEGVDVGTEIVLPVTAQS